jgi:uncharacterized protein
MEPSAFNTRVPLPATGEVFLMNTLSGAQLLASPDVAALLDRLEAGETQPAGPDEESALAVLSDHGFLVQSRAHERAALDEHFRTIREDSSDLRVTILTTLQCNFACSYCFQGDHGDYNQVAMKMTLDAAEQTAVWIEQRLDEVRPERLVVTFFGGEPLLNLPVLYSLSERLWRAAEERGVVMRINLITNGLLLTPDVVDRLAPYGLNGVKVTLDGDRAAHDRLRPLRGGQGTFDRIVENIRQVAGRCRVSIGGNFDESSLDSFPALLDFLKQQQFAGALAKVAFKPIIRSPRPAGIPLTAVDVAGKPLGGTCMTAAGSSGSPCDTCHFAGDSLSYLREETRKRGFPTVDGVHMGPCELHRRHAYTIGPDGSLYACPGFTGDATLSVGHIDGRREARRAQAAARFETLAPWRQCGDCTFVPVCGGGCSVAAHTELGDMNTPACHKRSFESALISLAHEAARAA